MQKFFLVGKNYFVNAILIAILAAFSVGGTFKGFLRSVFSLLGFVVAIGAAFALTPSVSHLAEEKSFLQAPISGAVQSVVEALDENFAKLEFSEQDKMLAYIKTSDIPLYAKSVLVKLVEKTNFEGKFTISRIVSRPLYSFAIRFVVFALLAIIFYVIVKILQIITLKMVRLPFLKVTDRVLGFLFGLTLGIVIYFLIVSIMLLVSQFVLSDWIIKKIEGGYLSSIFYQNFGDKVISAFYSLV